MVDRLVKVFSKLEVLEVSHIDFYSHASLINNIVSEENLEDWQNLTIHCNSDILHLASALDELSNSPNISSLSSLAMLLIKLA